MAHRKSPGDICCPCFFVVNICLGPCVGIFTEEFFGKGNIEVRAKGACDFRGLIKPSFTLAKVRERYGGKKHSCFVGSDLIREVVFIQEPAEDLGEKVRYFFCVLIFERMDCFFHKFVGVGKRRAYKARKTAHSTALAFKSPLDSPLFTYGASEVFVLINTLPADLA